MSLKSTSVVALRLVGVCIVLVMVGIPAALAREVVIGTSSDVRVSIGGSWTYDAPVSGIEHGADLMVFTDDNCHFIVSGGTQDVGHVLLAFPPRSKTIDIDVSDTYALREVTHDGSVYGVFSVVVGEHVHSVIAPPDEFAAALSDARARIFVDGSAVFFGVDEVALADLLPAGERADKPLIESASREPGTVSAESGTAVVSEESSKPRGSVVADDGEGSGGGEYVARWSGVRITWTEEWQVGVEEGELKISSSLEGYQYDDICLESADQTEGVGVCLTITRSSSIDNVEGWQARYASPGATSQFGIPYYGVHVAETSVIYADVDVQGEVASVSQGDVIGGLRITARVFSAPDRLVDVISSANAGVQANGRPILADVDAEQLQAETDKMLASLPAYQAERDANLKALGLVDPNHYVSSALGCDTEWKAPLELGKLGTLTPIDQATSTMFRGGDVLSEKFELYDTKAQFGGSITCLQAIASIESWIPWGEAQQLVVSTEPVSKQYQRYLAVEGADAYYVLERIPFTQPQLHLLVSSPGGPTVLFSFPVPEDGLASFLESVEPELLVINGIDVFQAMKDDGIANQLP